LPLAGRAIGALAILSLLPARRGGCGVAEPVGLGLAAVAIVVGRGATGGFGTVAAAGFARPGLITLAAVDGCAFAAADGPAVEAFSAGRAVAARGGVAARSLPFDGGALSVTAAYPSCLLSIFSEKVNLCRANRRSALSPPPT
jgi:hypothetical protein